MPDHARASISNASRAGGDPDADPGHLRVGLDSVSEAVIIVSRDRRVRFCNAAASELLGRKSGLTLSRGRIGCATETADRELGRSIDAACIPGAKRGTALVIRQAGPVPVLLSVQCLDRTGDTILLVANDPRPLGQRMVRPLRDYFGLTRSEALVAASIAEGKSIAAIAAERTVAVGTIRSQVKTIAAKLGCSGQARIAAIVRSIPFAALRA